MVHAIFVRPTSDHVTQCEADLAGSQVIPMLDFIGRASFPDVNRDLCPECASGIEKILVEWRTQKS